MSNAPQSSGLYDINGREIFAGSVVRFTTDSGQQTEAVVSFEIYDDDEQYMRSQHLGWIAKWPDPLPERHDHFVFETLPDIVSRCEVIDK